MVKLARHLIPRFDVGRWGGATLSDPSGRNEEADGGCFCIQWFGLMVEIGAGRIKGMRRG